MVPLIRNGLLSLLASLVLVPAAWATNWTQIMKDAAIADFSEEDLKAYVKTIEALLDAPQPAAPVEWSNPATGAGARLEVIGQPKIGGFEECRRVRTNVYSSKHKARPRTWTACRGKDGAWVLAKGS